MNGATIIAIAVIVALVVLAVTASIRKRSEGSSCCGCALQDCCSKVNKSITGCEQKIQFSDDKR